MGRKSSPWFRGWDGCWYATVRGERVKLARGAGAKKEAERRFHELMAGPADAPGGDGPISLFALSEAHADAALPRLAPETYANYRRFIGLFMASAGREALAREIRPHHVEKWLAGRPGWGPSTRRLAITVVKTLFAWGKAQGHLDLDPLGAMTRPPPKARAMAMDRGTFARIVAGLSERGRDLRHLLEFMHETGCRPSEAMRLEARHVDAEAGVATFDGKTTRKTGKVRTIHLTPAAAELCRRMAALHPEGPLFRNADGRPWTRDNLSSRFKRLRRKLGLPPGTCPETIRHGWITDALEAGVPIATVAELAGHADTDMVARVYSKLHERRDHLREGLEKVRPPHR